MSYAAAQKTSNLTRFSRAKIRDGLQNEGYAIIPKLIGDDELANLLKAARQLVDKAHAGHWPHLRTLPKQFPPWQKSPENGIWGVQHLLHPDLPLSEEDGDAFKKIYFGDEIIGVVKTVLGSETQECEDDMLVMELFNMLVTPDTDFELRWHRDDVSFELTLEEEAAALGLFESMDKATECKPLDSSYRNGLRRIGHRTPHHTQYNIPLLEDGSLHLVPGSHLRPRTLDEATKLASDPFTNELEHWIEVQLQPGDVVFYDNNLIHRGVYDAKNERLTLHGSIGDVRADGKRARNVLQHGCAWADQCKFESLQENIHNRAEGMRKRLVELGSREKDVGFSHSD